MVVRDINGIVLTLKLALLFKLTLKLYRDYKPSNIFLKFSTFQRCRCSKNLIYPGSAPCLWEHAWENASMPNSHFSPHDEKPKKAKPKYFNKKILRKLR